MTDEEMPPSQADVGCAIEMAAPKRHPEINAHIVCSECRAPFVLRRGHSITQGCAVVWVWQRDCKHKKAAPFAVEGP